MSKAKELFELHKKILDSTRILPESEGLYSKYTKLSEIEQEELTSYILEEYDLLALETIVEQLLDYDVEGCLGVELREKFHVLI